MGTLALDIETASPFDADFDGERTETLAWLAIALGFDDKGGEPESTVLLRRGDWGETHTADLFDRFIDWCDGHDIDRTLTYNGAWFDLRHMTNWAEELEASGRRPDAYRDLSRTVSGHVDLALASADRHEDELWEDQHILPDFKAYKLEGIDNESVWYEDYGLDPAYLASVGIEDPTVTGGHVGEVLGERYVEGVVAGLDDTRTHQALEEVLRDYCYSDVLDLFDLYDALGGDALGEAYHVPLDSVER